MNHPKSRWISIPVSYTHLDVYKRQSLSSVSDKAYSIREGMKTAEQRMKELQKLMEYGYEEGNLAY